MLALKRSRWLVPLGVLLLGGGALLLRMVHLGDKPLHHDESLHAYYAYEFFKGNGYVYTPITHGPLMFYFIALADWLVGVGDAAARTMTAFFGWILVLLPLLWRKEFGKIATGIAVVLLAISPSMLYLSRFARHDIFMHVWTLSMVIVLYGYITSRKGWLLLALGALAGLAFATHEISYILFFILATFVFGGALLERLLRRTKRPLTQAVRSLVRENAPFTIGGVLLFVAVAGILYSTFFTSKEGFLTALPNPFDEKTGLGYWLSQHEVRRGGQPWYYYFLTLGLYEFGAVILGLCGLWWYLRSRRMTLLGNLLLWWLVSFIAIFSWAGEKFPWLTTYPLLPLILFGAYAAGRALAPGRLRQEWVGFIGVLVLGGLTLFSSLRLSFSNPTNPEEMAVYVQTTKDAVRVGELIAADARLSGKEIADVFVDGELTWPFAWYLRDVAIRSYDKNLQSDPRTRYVLVSIMNEPQWQPFLGAYKKIGGPYQLRAWWVPPKFKNKPYTFEQVLNYFFTRQTWGDGKGSVDFSLYRRSS